MAKVSNGELWRVMVFWDFKVCYFVDLNSRFSRSSKKITKKIVAYSIIDNMQDKQTKMKGLRV